jgi:Ca2+-binding RTX toxin-like protein
MTLGTLKTLTEKEYLDLRYEFLKEIEEGGEENLELYSDTDQLVSTGVGFNLTVEDVIQDILQKGFDLTDSEDGSTYKEGKTERNLINAIINITKGKHPSSELSTIKTSLDALMVEYTTTKTEFKFEAIGTKTAKDKIKEVFSELAEYFEGELNSFLAANGYNDGAADTENNITNMTYSMERLALVSLAYGGPAKMLGAGLGGAIKEDNRMRAWFEIRYASNGDKTSGHAKRRYMESEIFGLYPSPVNFMNPQGAAQFAAYAEKIIAHFEEDSYTSNPHKNNLLHMINYEKTYGDMVEAAQANIDKITGLSLSVTPWGQLFKPVASYLIDHYIKNESSGLKGLNYFFDGDVNLGLDIDGIIESTDTSAAGKDKNDLLIAANNEIKNVLDGGKGNDFLIGAAKDDDLKGGDGNDALVGKAGTDKLAGGSGHDVLIGGAGNDELIGGEGVDNLQGGADTDTYIFEGNFNRDIIEDSDGKGIIKINDITLGNFKLVAGTDIIYRDNKNNPAFEAIKINEGNSTSLLIVPLGVATNAGTVVIKNWSEGGLGIHLGEPDATGPDMTGIWTIDGNGSDNAISATNHLVDNPTKSLTDYKGLSVDAGA